MKKYIVSLSLLASASIFAETVNYEAEISFTGSRDYFSKSAIVGKTFYKAEVAVHEKCVNDGGTFGETRSHITNIKMFKHCKELPNNVFRCEAKAVTKCSF